MHIPKIEEEDVLLVGIFIGDVKPKNANEVFVPEDIWWWWWWWWRHKSTSLLHCRCASQKLGIGYVQRQKKLYLQYYSFFQFFLPSLCYKKMIWWALTEDSVPNPLWWTLHNIFKEILEKNKIFFFLERLIICDKCLLLLFNETRRCLSGTVLESKSISVPIW